MKQAERNLELQRKERIRRSRTVALDVSQQYQDAIRQTGKKGALALGAATLATVLLTGSAYALPKGEQVKAGSSTFSRPNAATLHITQSTKKSIINWQGYSIAAGESVKYIQPSSSAISLNRVTGSDPSALYGSLSANGQVWVINPNGLLVGPNARINVGGFLASTLGLSDQDFLTGNYCFRGDASVGSILNSGEIQGGFVALVSPSITNEGTIQASRGTVALASGDQVTLNFAGNDLVGFVVDLGTTSSSGISNTGILSGNSVVLTAKGASDVVRNVVNNTGVIEARAIEERNGEIVLSGDGVMSTGLVDASGKQGGTIQIDGEFVALGGTITADGRTQGGSILVNSSGILSLADRVQARGLKGTGGQVTYFSAGQTLETSTSVTDVSGKKDGGSIQLEAQGGLLSSGTYLASGGTGLGGRIDLSGYSVRLISTTMDASGWTQGGLVRIGGAFQGGKDPDPSKTYNDGFLTRWGTLNEISNAEKVFVNDTTAIDLSADAPKSSGGTVVIWSNAETTMLGRVAASGQTSGGYVEVSSADQLRQADILKIDTGKGGELLLDPKNIVIGDNDDIGNWSYQGILGKGYIFGKNVNVVNLESMDQFGESVSLNGVGNRLAVGAKEDSGGDVFNLWGGAVYLFSFTDTNFNGGTLQGIIGKGYAGGKNVNVTNLDWKDYFGESVSLNGAGNRLAVGVQRDNGYSNSTYETGAVYLFSFSDTNFTSGSLQGILGKNYTGGKNVNVTNLEDSDYFGESVSLNGAGNRLAVGAYGDDGYGNSVSGSGAVYLFSFSDTNFTGGSLKGILGKGYTGGKNMTVANLEGDDTFGRSVSLNDAGNRLAVGAQYDEGYGNSSNLGTGAVYLFSFTDTNFNGGSLQGIIGKDYTGGKNMTVANLEHSDYFGASVSLNGAGDRLAVGAEYDKGYGNSSYYGTGAVYLFSFTDTNFNGGSLQGIIGKGYTGGKNVDVAHLYADQFGHSVSLNGAGDRLIVGAPCDEGSDHSADYAGAAYLFSWTSSKAPVKNYAYSDSSNQKVTLLNSDIATWLNGGSNMTLQANNDITLNAPITVNNATGNGGALTLAAGRSLILNGNITTDNGNLILTANDTLANGVVNAYRDAGTAVISQASGTSINAGAGAVTITLRDGNGKTYTTSGDITLSGITAATLNVTNAGLTAGSDILQNGGSIKVTGTTKLAAGTNNIALNRSTNNFSTVAGKGKNITLVDANGLNLYTTTASGNLKVIATGNISDSGKIAVTGTATLNSGAYDIALNTSTNNFSTVAGMGRNVTLVDANGLNLYTTTASGNLKVIATGNISDSGKIAVTGTATLNSGAYDIALNTSTNNFSTVAGMGRNVTLVDANALNLYTTKASGKLNVKATGNITDSGKIAVTGTTTLNAGTSDIVLNTSTNDFSKIAVTAGRNFTLVDANALKLGVSTLSGTVGISSHGTLTLLGDLNAGANKVKLNAGTGAIDGAYTVTAGDVTLSGATIGTVAHPTINASGLLTLTATSTVNGISANLLGPTDLDVVVNSAPGKVLLNGKVIYP
ncbi:filamentous hemagglutinin family N-terminal domain-containing protein [Syntrophus gentianae]|uniref:Filamentous hemagglutinin family N-terminal domain-containing protein n=1 Tax=Syntrophus gentianae TaxID=43775 RepID=A0A1H7ZEJ7_9BACT|nr:filamentous hemagglutinin N-terminal domain-containing protein [Syntrophus gentianae]SEM56982.1 filamentous hemagglutinin family N-terminal domain-containing protein [Syntrophus gentianae]